MAYEEKRTHDEDIGLAPILKILRQILSKWWLIVIFVALFSASGFGIAKITYTEQFSSNLILTVSNKDKNISSVQAQTTASDAQASAVIANTLKYLMQSGDGFITAVQKEVKSRTDTLYDKDTLRGMMSVEHVADSMIVKIKVTSTDKELAYIVATSIESAYHTIVNDENFPTAHITVADSATEAKPVADSSMVLYTGAGLIIGAALAIIIILITAKIQNKLLSTEDIKNNFSNIDIIATVSNIKGKKKNDRTRLLITDRNVGLPFIETFKLIRTKFENAKLKKGYSVFAVTSSTESEGKTTCSTNIALSLAKSGKSVLLIDADLRKPAVCKTLGINIEGERGIYDIVNGVKSFEESVKYIEKYNLYLLVSSAAVADPSETLASDSTARIIAEAKKNFDYVIVDCPPAGVVADAAIVANYVDSMVFVAAEERVAIPQIEYALSDILTTKADIMGCIYNRAGTGTLKIATEKAGGYFSNRYGGYYGSSYYYGSRHHKKKR
ncbi:MAG: polysaccharide biosynthesis tyrosine autokinase [Clostridia bacterium]|nr:polysaccharide biosynthesis tyrosine autokinase [Clostridia bacterium]